MDDSKNRILSQQAHVLAVLPAFTSAAEVLIVNPLHQLAKTTKIQFDAVLEGQLTRSKILWADVVVFHANTQQGTWHWHEELVTLRKPTIYVLDNNFWVLPDHSLHSPIFGAFGSLQQVENYIRFARLVKVYNPLVYRHVQHLTPNGVMASAGIDFSRLPKRPPAQDRNTIRIICLNDDNANSEWSALFEQDLLGILSEYSDRVQMVFIGRRPAVFEQISNVETIQLDPQDGLFIQKLALAHCDIGLAPLQNTDYYRSQTNAALRGFGACRIAGIYSNLEPYHAVVNGHTGLLVDQQPGAWYTAMHTLIENDVLRSAIQQQAYQFVYDTCRLEVVEQQWQHEINAVVFPDESNPPLIRLPKRDALPIRLVLGALEGDKWDDFIKIDNCLRPGIHIVADWSAPLPLAADATDLIVLNRVLEQVENQQSFIKEINRLACNGAQICICSTYGHHTEPHEDKGSISEINEQTPRDWTSAIESGVYPDEYCCDTPENFQPWGTGHVPELDLRCAEIQFIYNSALQGMLNIEKRSERKKSPAVCKQILIQLVAVKTSNNLSIPLNFFEPEFFQTYRLRELNAAYRQESLQCDQTIRDLEAYIEEKQQLVNRLQATINQMQIEARTQNELLSNAYEKADFIQQSADETASEVDQYREHKLIGVIQRLVDRTNLYTDIDSIYGAILDDSLMFNHALNRYILQMSSNLQLVPCHEYQVNWPRQRSLTGILLASVIDVPLTRGMIGVELVSGGRIIAQVTQSANLVARKGPVQLTFAPPVDIPAGHLIIRIFARDLNAPMRVYEWRRYRALGLILRRKIFCGFLFKD